MRRLLGHYGKRLVNPSVAWKERVAAHDVGTLLWFGVDGVVDDHPGALLAYPAWCDHLGRSAADT